MPAVSPMSDNPVSDIEKNRNRANLKLRHALRADGIISCISFVVTYTTEHKNEVIVNQLIRRC